MHLPLCIVSACMRNNPKIVMPDEERMASLRALSLGTGHHWHTPAPWTACPAPIVCRGQSKDDKKQMEMLAHGLSLCTPAADE